MMLIVAPLSDILKVLYLVYVLEASKPNLTDLVDLAASLADNRSNHVIGHRHFMSS